MLILDACRKRVNVGTRDRRRTQRFRAFDLNFVASAVLLSFLADCVVGAVLWRLGVGFVAYAALPRLLCRICGSCRGKSSEGILADGGVFGDCNFSFFGGRVLLKVS